MNNYSLNKYSSLTYLDEFDTKDIEMVSDTRSGSYCFKIGPEDRRFGIEIKTEDFLDWSTILKTVRNIISQIVEMDNIARLSSSPRSTDYEEILAYVVVSSQEVELRYYATTVNTEWGAYFERQENDSWKFEGLG